MELELIRKFFHKEVIIKRGDLAKSFFIVTNGKAIVLNSAGESTNNQIFKNQPYGLIDILHQNKWKNTVVSESNSEILFISREKLIKNVFSSKAISSLTMNILKMAH